VFSRTRPAAAEARVVWHSLAALALEDFVPVIPSLVVSLAPSYPIGTVKIDRIVFLEKWPQNRGAIFHLVETIIVMARMRLCQNACSRGEIETVEQLDFLREPPRDIAQGFLSLLRSQNPWSGQAVTDCLQAANKARIQR